jgi:malate/lactate dehydrogenase
LIDIKEGFAEGKAMDLMQTASLNGFDSTITRRQTIIQRQLTVMLLLLPVVFPVNQG